MGKNYADDGRRSYEEKYKKLVNKIEELKIPDGNYFLDSYEFGVYDTIKELKDYIKLLDHSGTYKFDE